MASCHPTKHRGRPRVHGARRLEKRALTNQREKTKGRGHYCVGRQVVRCPDDYKLSWTSPVSAILARIVQDFDRTRSARSLAFPWKLCRMAGPRGCQGTRFRGGQKSGK
ncbi:worker-enriched antennal transcript isoform X5 [Calliopsis andreniformis]|uniref:worker-enriched antennal transcript isoform X5 n=1 Tax=Calliopsis andreniformis TaxID=337506 RepID=UPI003FCD23E1